MTTNLPMTAQEIFDTVATHLLTQNTKSCDPEGGCRYRGPNNLKCAIGFLIPDSIYQPEMERRDIDDVFESYPELGKLFDDDTSNMLSELQYIHDYTSPKHWVTELRSLAVSYDVYYDVLDTVNKPTK